MAYNCCLSYLNEISYQIVIDKITLIPRQIDYGIALVSVLTYLFNIYILPLRIYCINTKLINYNTYAGDIDTRKHKRIIYRNTNH